MGKCHKCGLKFSKQDYVNASKGVTGCLVGDWDWVCYPCEFKMIDDNTWDSFKDKMLGKCEQD